MSLHKHIAYFRYVVAHKYHVLRASLRLGIPLRGLLHDLSKFRPDEWGPYSEYYYGEYPQSHDEIQRGLPPQNVVIRYWDANRRHFNRNSHHWQHWILFQEDAVKAMPIPLPVLKEMLADWYSFAVCHGAVDGWKASLKHWQAHQDNILMYPDSKKWIDDNLRYLAR
jgi:hypothetical protein